MNTYELYFELYGKKMKTEVSAKSEEDAKQKVRNKIIFHKVKIKINDDNVINMFRDIFGGKI